MFVSGCSIDVSLNIRSVTVSPNVFWFTQLDSVLKINVFSAVEDAQESSDHVVNVEENVNK
jgi:hypothetical protein